MGQCQACRLVAGRPVLCDLTSAQATVLERNVSAGVVRRHKYATL
ncbi:hypothetical protein [Streptomyces sp. ISL-98]|nr:hypothetical protein [Streptomyces sp. ISL-98]